MSRPTRRHVLASIGVAASASALPGRPEAHAATAPPPPAGAWALLAPLGPGSPLDLGWSLVDAEPPRLGACVLSLEHRDGSEARVHLCRREGRPAGIAHTDRFDLLLMNGGTGGTPSRESLGRVLLGLAEHLSRREQEPTAATLLSELQPHAERLLAHPEGDALA